MTKKTITSLFSIVAITALTIGCGSSSTTKAQEPTALVAPTAQVQTVEENLTVNAGVVSQETIITVNSKDGTATSEVTVPAGTTFTDASGKKLETVVPQVSLSQDVGAKSEETEQKLITQTKIEITDQTGTKIIPSEPMDVKVKAPSGAKPGDEVNVSIPENASKTPGQEKLVIFIVDANGFITVRLFPDVFKNTTVILIIVERTIPLTGAEGGN